MHWEKSVPSNLFRIAGIPVIGVQTNRSDCIWNRQWYWSQCQNTWEKNFQVVTCKSELLKINI